MHKQVKTALHGHAEHHHGVGDILGMYLEWDTSTNLNQKPIWDALSSQYANGAEGIATYVHPDGYVGKVWSNIEKPILEENDIIIREVIIDAE
ncbi:MAG: hypothetical protein K2N15_03175 [Lachnospiraceae bacterium]|nr:hypothetical protein [Lachnospiraceae bacterium]